MVAVVRVGKQKPIGDHLALSRFSLLSKESWHSILDPRENRIENRDCILNCYVSLLDSCDTHQIGMGFV